VAAHRGPQAGSPLDGDDPDMPILLAMSDNGPQMRAGTTREFLALCSIVAHFGRSGTPTDQAWIETLFGHVKADWPHLEDIDDPAALAAELEIVRAESRYAGDPPPGSGGLGPCVRWRSCRAWCGPRVVTPAA
jgi:transposase InsO family protein